MSHFEHGGSAVSLELLDAISTVAGMADDLLRVEPFLANVVKRVVEQAGQLAEGLGLEVGFLVSLLTLFHFILQSIESPVNRILQVVESLRYLLLDDVQPCRKVCGRQCPACQQEEAGEDALKDRWWEQNAFLTTQSDEWTSYRQQCRPVLVRCIRSSSSSSTSVLSSLNVKSILRYLL